MLSWYLFCCTRLTTSRVSPLTLVCRDPTSQKHGVPEDDVLDPDPPIVDDLDLKRQQGDTRNWDWKCGFIPQFGERKPCRADCVCFRGFCPIEEDRVILSIADDDELSGDEVSPRCDLLEISLRQVGRVLFNEVLYQVRR
jgi:hypothetical protein